MRAFVPIWCIAIFLAVGSASARPSYECRGNLNATETTICRDRILAGLDWHMAGLFFRLESLHSGSSADQLTREQRRWRLTQRDGCGAQFGCIEARYTERIRQLSGLLAARLGEGNACFPGADSGVLSSGYRDIEFVDGALVAFDANGNKVMRGFSDQCPWQPYEEVDGKPRVLCFKINVPMPPEIDTELKQFNYFGTVERKLDDVLVKVVPPDYAQAIKIIAEQPSNSLVTEFLTKLIAIDDFHRECQ